MRYVVAFAVLCSGCSIAIEHGPPPAMPSEPVERCVAERALRFAPADVELRGLNQTSGSITSIDYRGNVQINPSGLSTTAGSRTSLTGLTPYEGTDRLSPFAAMALLEMEDRYRETLRPFRRGRWRPLTRSLWVLSLVAGTGLLVAGLVEMQGKGYDPDTDTTDYGNTFYYLGGAIGAYLFMIPWILLDFNAHDAANQWRARRRALVLNGDLAADVATANEARNRRLEADCR